MGNSASSLVALIRVFFISATTDAVKACHLCRYNAARPGIFRQTFLDVCEALLHVWSLESAKLYTSLRKVPNWKAANQMWITRLLDRQRTFLYNGQIHISLAWRPSNHDVPGCLFLFLLFAWMLWSILWLEILKLDGVSYSKTQSRSHAQPLLQIFRGTTHDISRCWTSKTNRTWICRSCFGYYWRKRNAKTA